MGEIDDEDELDENEQESANHSQPPEGGRSIHTANVEEPEHEASHQQVFEEPEAVLDRGTGVFRALHVHHQQGEEEEECCCACTDSEMNGPFLMNLKNIFQYFLFISSKGVSNFI